MAIVDPRTKKKLQDQEVSSLPQASSTGLIGGANSQTLSNNPGTAGNDPSNKARSGSGFTNLGQYAQANQGRGQKLVDTVNQNVKSKFNDNLVGQARTAANAAIGSGPNVNQINQINSQVQSGNYGGINKEAFNKAISSSYGGPTSSGAIKEVQDAGVQINKQLHDAQRLNDAKQRGTLIRDAFNKGAYSRGGGNLDSYIYGQADSSESKNILDRAKADQAAYNKMTQGLSGSIADRQKAVQEAVAQLQKNYNTALTNTQSSVQKMLTNAQQQAIDANKTENEKYNSLINPVALDINQDGKVDLKDRFLLSQLEPVRGKINFNQFANKGGNYSQGDFVDQNQLSNLTALMGLTGLKNNVTVNPATGGSASSINADKLKFLENLALAMNQDKVRSQDWLGKAYNLPPSLEKVRSDFETMSRMGLKSHYGLSNAQIDNLDRYQKSDMDKLFERLKIQPVGQAPTNPIETAEYSRTAEQAQQLNDLMKSLGIEGKTYGSRSGPLWTMNKDTIGDMYALQKQLNPMSSDNDYTFVREGTEGFKRKRSFGESEGPNPYKDGFIFA